MSTEKKNKTKEVEVTRATTQYDGGVTLSNKEYQDLKIENHHLKDQVSDLEKWKWWFMGIIAAIIIMALSLVISGTIKISI
ncbi:MAG: hypothetical protein V1668_02920 [Patescibacteria group bacterium]